MPAKFEASKPRFRRLPSLNLVPENLARQNSELRLANTPRFIVYLGPALKLPLDRWITVSLLQVCA